MSLTHLAISALTLVMVATIASAATTGLRSQPHFPQDDLSRAKRMNVDGAVGPESLAFDPRGGGPYTGVADGRILKWLGKDSPGWVEFAVTSSQRTNCSIPYNPQMEHICGRPLGLRFDQRTEDLYIADAYLGIHVVGPSGGLATPLVTQVEGRPLRFANDVDIDEENNVLYFTESSTTFQRWESAQSFLSMERTGSLMKYDITTKQVTVLMRGLAFANGVSLSKDRSFVLVAETTARRIRRLRLQGPNAGSHDVFVRLPGMPDNIRRSPKGNFWVALVLRRTPTETKATSSYSQLGRNTSSGELPHTIEQYGRREESYFGQAIAVKLSNEGKILKVLKDVEGRTLRFIGEVQERNGTLWIGSAVTPYVGIYTLK